MTIVYIDIRICKYAYVENTLGYYLANMPLKTFVNVLTLVVGRRGDGEEGIDSFHDPCTDGRLSSSGVVFLFVFGS